MSKIIVGDRVAKSTPSGHVFGTARIVVAHLVVVEWDIEPGAVVERGDAIEAA